MKKPESLVEKLKRLARERAEQVNGTPAASPSVVTAALADAPIVEPIALGGIELTGKQKVAVEYALARHPFCLTGAAGTGKTTTTRNIVQGLIQNNLVTPLQITHNYLTSGVPGIVGCAFTNKAVQNIKRFMPKDLQKNFITIHKLLEFMPEYYDEYDEKEGKMCTKMRFVPARNKLNPLPSSLQVLIIEEATMVGIDLWNMLFDALPLDGKIQIILIGDIQQLPPVFGKSIFIHAMQSGVRTVELDKVHRQALESPILALAHRILSGKVIPINEWESWNKTTEVGKLELFPWKKELPADMACRKFAKDFMPKKIEAGQYDPMQDAILCPYNKSDFGCNEINKHIATYLAQSDIWNPNKNMVFEVTGGVNTKYFRVGDKVLWNKTEHIVTDIKVNAKYFEKEPQLPSRTLNYWGHETDDTANDALMAMLEGGEVSKEHEDKIDAMLASFASSEGSSDRSSRQASHIITVESEEFGSYSIETSGDLANLDLAYAITVHKSQGSEYRRVYFVTHKSMATMIFRELLYTAVTRAKEDLMVIGAVNLFVQGVTTQRLPGKTLEEKIKSFSRYLETSKVSETELPRGMALLTK